MHWCKSDTQYITNNIQETTYKFKMQELYHKSKVYNNTVWYVWRFTYEQRIVIYKPECKQHQPGVNTPVAGKIR